MTNYALQKNVKWIKHKGKALGVWFSTNLEEALEANYADKLAKVSNSFGCWELRVEKYQYLRAG